MDLFFDVATVSAILGLMWNAFKLESQNKEVHKDNSKLREKVYNLVRENISLRDNISLRQGKSDDEDSGYDTVH
jgi:hypothetical protein